MPSLPTLKLGDTGPNVRRLQLDLNGLGANYNGFLINGIFDLKTKNAVANFQDKVRLTRDGIVGPATWFALTYRVKDIQNKLNSLGYNTGIADGWFGPITTDAVKRFQIANGLKPEGIVNPRTRQKLFNPNSKDNYDTRPSSLELSSLDPKLEILAKKFLELTKANNLDVRILTAFRSWDYQDVLFAQGRTTPGGIVTNARGGDSYHNWGLAFDAYIYENGKIINDPVKYKKMGELGKQVGLKWGGDFNSIVDYPHFQYTYGLSTEDLQNGKRPPT